MTNPKLQQMPSPFPSDSEVLSTFKDFLKSSYIPENVWNVSSVAPAPSVPTEELIEMTQEVIDILERDGWIQGNYQRNSQVCLVGAARKAVGSNAQLAAYSPKMHAWLSEMGKFLGLDVAFIGQAIEGWNDTTGRTFDEVISKLRDFMYELKGR